MKKIVFSFLLISIFAIGSQAQMQTQEQTKFVTVELDYGGIKTNESMQVKWYKGMTAMTALQKCATIESYPVKEYIFVTTINGVRTNKGIKAWYYTVNGESIHKLAFRYYAKPNDTIRWIYKEDVCSGKIDNKECEK